MPLLEKIAHTSVPRKVVRAGYPGKHLGGPQKVSMGSNAYLSFGLIRMMGSCVYTYMATTIHAREHQRTAAAFHNLHSATLDHDYHSQLLG